MSRDNRTGNPEAARIEARLERSLRNQVKAPRLDGRFDAAVWTRIANESKSAPPVPRVASPARMPRWLVAGNAIGVAVTVILLAWYVLRSMSGLDLASFGFSWPDLSGENGASAIRITGVIIGAIAMGYGFLCTRAGRRLISEFR